MHFCSNQELSPNIKATSIPHTWNFVPKIKSNDDGAQIDLLFERSDDSITVCEIKCTDKPYIFDKKSANLLDKKLKIFQAQTRTKKQLFAAFFKWHKAK